MRTRKAVAWIGAVCMLMSGCAPAMDNRVQITAMGDSYTLRTRCDAFPNDWEGCIRSGGIDFRSSYASYLGDGLVGVRVGKLVNAARGGDTCTDQTAWESGVWKGESRGLLSRTRGTQQQKDDGSSAWAILLIGINDVNRFHVQKAELQDCLREVISALTSWYQKVFVLTYPRTSTNTTVWQPFSDGDIANVGLVSVNAEIRAAVAFAEEEEKRSNVFLVETSSVWDMSETVALTSDGAHPNEAGARRLAASISKAMHKQHQLEKSLTHKEEGTNAQEK